MAAPPDRSDYHPVESCPQALSRNDALRIFPGLLPRQPSKTRYDRTPDNWRPIMTRVLSPALFCGALLLLSALLSADAQTSSGVRFLNPPTMAKPPGYTHVVEVTGPGRTVYIAGQLGYDAKGQQGKDFREQATLVYENLKAAVESVGGKMENVVKLNAFLTDIRAQLPIYREVRDKFINTGAPPASTTLEVPKLARDGALIEVEAIAVLPAR
jgi:enamine deaminase RidA (YjgF/YER057c/UK114 family)